MIFAAARCAIAGSLFAAIAEPVDAELDSARLAFRKSLAAEFARGSPRPWPSATCQSRTRRWPQRHSLALLVEGLIGPLAPDASGRERDVVQSLTLVALRALGVADARARGLVVQTKMPTDAKCVAPHS